MTVVRDFIYLDVQRLKSVAAQLNEGILEGRSTARVDRSEVSGSARLSLLSFLTAGLGSRLLSEASEHESWTLHDHLYSLVERALIAEGLVAQLMQRAHTAAAGARQRIESVPFVLATGQVRINHFPYMRSLLDGLPTLIEFLARSRAQAELFGSGKGKDAIKQRAKALVQEMGLDQKTLDVLKGTLDLFYKARISLKLTPYAEDPAFRLAAPLREENLRDDIMSIIYKYGTAPTSPWTMFGLTAHVPALAPKASPPEAGTGGSIEAALDAVFDSLRELEETAQSVKYPEVSVTPIAVYR